MAKYTEDQYRKVPALGLAKRLLNPAPEKDDVDAIKAILTKIHNWTEEQFEPAAVEAFVKENTLDLSGGDPNKVTPKGVKDPKPAKSTKEPKPPREPKAPREPRVKQEGEVNFNRELDFEVEGAGGQMLRIGTVVSTFKGKGDVADIGEAVIYQFWRRGTGVWSADVKFADGVKRGRALKALTFVADRPENYVVSPRTKRAPVVVLAIDETNEEAPEAADNNENADNTSEA